MRLIELDGRRWRTYDDIFDGLLPALGAPHWHGRNINALVDSIGTGSINAIEPPYRLRIAGAEAWPPEVLSFMRDLRTHVAERIRSPPMPGEALRDLEIVLLGEP
jgi:hypothetical protein